MSAEHIPQRIERLSIELADALEADDATTALIKVRAMRALISSVPNSGGAISNLQWDRMSLDQLERSLVRRRNAKGGVLKRIPLRTVRPGIEESI